jgi:hypothetical protein
MNNYVIVLNNNGYIYVREHTLNHDGLALMASIYYMLYSSIVDLLNNILPNVLCPIVPTSEVAHSVCHTQY